MPRPQNPEVRRRLLAAGLELIFTRGFNGCGVQEITAAAGIPKGSFYNYFVTKDAFAVAVLEEYWKWVEKNFCSVLRNPKVKPLDRIAKYFRAMTDEKQARKFTLGCLIGNLSLEVSDSSPDARQKLANIFKLWQEPIAATLREAQERNELSRDRKVDDLAAALIEAWEGAVMRGKVEQQRESYRRFESITLPRLLQ
jgi:TetR/AcrR family transcriptional regulator, transcriptional repressor for nem operon